jgi:hypothetical protein
MINFSAFLWHPHGSRAQRARVNQFFEKFRKILAHDAPEAHESSNGHIRTRDQKTLF